MPPGIRGLIAGLIFVQGLGLTGRGLYGDLTSVVLAGPAMGGAALVIVGLATGRLRWARGGALLAALAFLIEAGAELSTLEPLSFVTPVAHAVRFGLPLSLALDLGGHPRAGRLLVLAAAAVFVGHGVECLAQHPRFLQFLQVVPARWMGVSLSFEEARPALLAIGALDIGVGLTAAFTKSTPRTAALRWMTFWGFLTATVRVLYFGPVGWPEALIRIGNGGAPLTLLLLPQAKRLAASRHRCHVCA